MQRDAKHWFRIIIITSLSLLIVSYAIYQSRKLLEGPEITITEPQNGTITLDSLLTIKGVAENINSINLDDRPIFIDEQGNFEEKLLLYPGYNIIKFEARDKFGKEKTLNLEVVYQAPIPPIIPMGTSTITATSTATTSAEI